jgi:hypothetical protein
MPVETRVRARHYISTLVIAMVALFTRADNAGVSHDRTAPVTFTRHWFRLALLIIHVSSSSHVTGETEPRLVFLPHSFPDDGNRDGSPSPLNSIMRARGRGTVGSMA